MNDNIETLQNGELILQKSESEKMKLISELQKKKNKLRKDLKEKGILTNGAKNEYDNYEYFSEAQYKELFTDLFSTNGIELLINELNYGTFEGTDKQPFGRIVTLACTLIDVDTGYSETSNHTGEGLDRGDKAGYKATTGALKRFLSSTFLVATKDDPEIEEETKRVKQKDNIASKIGITPKQISILESYQNKNKDKFEKYLNVFKKKKINELSSIEASKIITELIKESQVQ